MRKPIILLLILISIGIVLSGCANTTITTTHIESTPFNVISTANSAQNNTVKQETANIKAVYLVLQNSGMLSQDELKQRTEVAVVNSFDELKKYIDEKVPILIDKDAINMIENGWLQKEPQKKYPIVLVGYNDSLYSFREKMPAFGIKGPQIDWTKTSLEPGFSVWMLREENASSKSAFMRGYKVKPTVELILNVTNALLENKIPDYIVEDRDESQDKVISPIKREENLTSIEYPNLNNESNLKVTMPLKEGWTATRLTWERPQDFEYNEIKNKPITEFYEYYIYNEKKEEIGWFGTIGRYHDSDNSSFPNHLQFKDVRYNGPTRFGRGKIYLLQLDLPKDERTKDRDSFREYYALIPINGENIAYNFYLKVPEKENVNDTLDSMKDILVTEDDIEEQVRELFKGDKTTPENTTEIINLITYIDWSKYAKKNIQEFSETMMWLGNLKISNEDMLMNILNATNGLDGAYTDAYCSAVKKLFFNNKEMFVKVLVYIDDEQVKLISSFVHYDCNSEEANQVEDYLKNITDSSSAVAKEVNKAKLFLEAFK